MDEPESYTVTIEPSGTRIRTHGISILEVTRRAGIHVSSMCGGRGTCGKCRVILSPEPRVTSLDVKYLSPHEIDEGVRLACQHTVRGNLIVRTLEESTELRHAEAAKGRRRLRRDQHPVGTYGLAIDIGTTTLACYLLDMASGIQVAEEAILNPQSTFGADVISRIDYASREQEGAPTLQRVLVKELDSVIVRLCNTAGVALDGISYVGAVGNTTMEHLFVGLDVRPLGLAPFKPTMLESLTQKGSEVGLRSAGNATVAIAPVVSGFVGGDTVAFILNEALHECEGVAIGIDIGTNGEIVLAEHGRVWCCSAAAGPAFEGATISQGMRAQEGAIEYVTMNGRDEPPEVSTIGEIPARGICGSGILDLVAEMIRWNVVDASGRYSESARLVQGGSGPATYTVTAPENSYQGHPITFSQRDVRQVQLAKAAISAGTMVLMKKTSVGLKDIDQLFLAGAFGSYLRPESAMRIGLLPPVERSQVVCVGNAAGGGAKRMVLSSDERKTADMIARSARYIELATNDFFKELFIRATSFDHSSLWSK